MWDALRAAVGESETEQIRKELTSLYTLRWSDWLTRTIDPGSFQGRAAPIGRYSNSYEVCRFETNTRGEKHGIVTIYRAEQPLTLSLIKEDELTTVSQPPKPSENPSRVTRPPAKPVGKPKRNVSKG